ncbi:MAG: cadherin-like beta sandwich domain-containing protein [Peptococcia bacterium]
MSKKMIRFGRRASLCLLIMFICLLIPLTVKAGVTFNDAQAAGNHVSAGGEHSLALKVNGEVVAWGDNTFGQCDIPDGLSDVKMISAGKYHSLALKKDGTVVAWGAKNDSEHPDVDYGQSIVPDDLNGVEVIAVAAGYYHSLALTADGIVIAWGAEGSIYDYGQSIVPDDLNGVEITAIAAGGYHSLALKADGTVKEWGRDYSGAGDYIAMPEDLSNPETSKVIAIAAGGYHSLALKEDRSVVAWGLNTFFQCDVPEVLDGVVAISAGDEFSVVLRDAENIKAWGNIDSEFSGNLNLGAVSAGASHILAINYYNSSIKAWGDNTSGQVSVPKKLYLISLDNLSVNLENFSFDPGVRNYSLNVDNDIKSVDIIPFLENPEIETMGASWEDGAMRSFTLGVGYNRIDVNVYVRSLGIKGLYMLQITRAASDTDLKTLKTNIGVVKPAFKPGITQYTVNVDNKDVDSIEFTATANDPTATITVAVGEETYALEEPVPFDYGETPVDIIVEKDGKSQVYELLIRKAGFLESLSVSGGQLTSAFDPEMLGYTISVNSNVDSLAITPTLLDPRHELWIDDIKYEKGVSKEVSLLGDIIPPVQIAVKEPSEAELIRTYEVYINCVDKNDFVGSGILGDPYLIHNLYELQEIAYDPSLLDKHFQLACSLDATNTVNWNNGAGFVPIGSAASPFAGQFDGAGYTIIGLHIDRPNDDYVGLFGCMDGGEIKNLGLVDCTINGHDNVGALVGHNQNTHFANCFSTGNVYGNSSVGGLVGFGSGSYAGNYYFNNCYSWVSVTGDSEVGGLIGKLGNGWLNNCYASGSVFGMENKGGLVGSLVTAYCRHTNCFWDTEESGQVGSALGIGKTTAEMQDKETYGEWDFDSIWDLDSGINEDYPYLRIFKDTFSPIIDDSLLLWLDGRHGSNDTSERTIWRDISGNANHGTLTRFDFNENSGWIGESLFFDGVNDYVNCGTKMNNKLMNAVTVEALVKIKSYDIQNWVESFLAWGNQASRTVIWLGYRVLSHYTFEVGNEVVCPSIYFHDQDLLEQVIHIVGTYEDGTLKLFKNGDLINQVQTTNLRRISVREDSCLLGIYRGNGHTFHGDYYTARVYNRALTDEEVAQNYQAEVPRIKAATAGNLAELTISSGVLQPAFKASKLNYVVILRERELNEVIITATPVSADARVTIDGFGGQVVGTQSLPVDVFTGSKEVPIVVKEADGSTKTYKIRIVKASYLSDLTLNGNPLPNFDPETLEYTVDVLYDTAFANIVATLDLEDSPMQELLINNQPHTSGTAMQIPLDVGKNNTIPIKIKVPGCETDYTLNIYRASKVDLKKLEMPGTLVPEFTPANIGPYTINLDRDPTPDQIRITATAFESDATVSIEGASDAGGLTDHMVDLVSGKNEIEIKVTKDGLEKIYTLNVFRPLTLSDIKVKQGEEELELSPSFNKDELEYRVEVDDNVLSLEVSAEAIFDVDVYINGVKTRKKTISDLTVGTNVILIDAKMSDMSTTTYKLLVTRGTSTVTLDDLKIKHKDSEIGTWNEPFLAPGNEAYTVTLAKAMDSIDIMVVPTDPEAKVIVAQSGSQDFLTLWPLEERVPVPVRSGENVIPITVKGVDGVTANTYTLNVIRPGGLETLEIENDTMESEYAKDVNDYSVKSNVFLVKVTPTLEDLATQELYINVNSSETDTKCVSGETQVLELNKGINTVAIKVKTPSNNLVNTYTLNVNVVPLVEDVGMDDIDGTGSREVQSVFGAQVLSKLNFNLSQSVSQGLKIKFDLPEALDIQKVIGLYRADELVTNDIIISQEDVPEGVVAGNNVITINSSLDPGAYEVKFILTNEPIKLKVGLDSFSEVDGNVLECRTEPLEIEYVDFPELL